MAISQNFPTSRPSLSLNFARSKILDPRITFTRSSNATYVDENGIIQTAGTDVARFDHNPATGESLGLLIEESRTNLYVTSENFQSSNPPLYGNWNTSNTTADTALSPNNTQTADTLSPQSPSASIVRRFTATAGQTYTYSVYIKRNPSSNDTLLDYLGFVVAWSNNGSTLSGNTTFNLFGSQSETFPTSPLTNEWKRFSFSYTCPVGAVSMEMGISNRNAGGGNPGYSVYVWGAQIEQGSFPTSYIPTSGSTVTRSVDIAKITGTNFSSWYNASEGTILAEYYADTPVSESPFGFAKIGAELTDVIAIGASSDGPTVGVFPTFAVVDSGVTQTGMTVTIRPTTGDLVKTAAAYKENDFAIFSTTDTESGFATDSSGTIPAVDFAWIGKYPYFGIWQNRPISRLAYYPKRLTNAQLQELTK